MESRISHKKEESQERQRWEWDLKLAGTTLILGRGAAGGEGNGTPRQYSCLENPMDRGARWAAVHGVAKSQTQLSDFTFSFHFHALEKEMATHSNLLAWRIPGMAEPGGLLSMGSHRVGHDWSDLAAAAAGAAGKRGRAAGGPCGVKFWGISCGLIYMSSSGACGEYSIH